MPYVKTMHQCGLAVRYREGTVDERMLNEASFDKDMYLSNVPEYVLEDDTKVLDIGAHIGAFSLLVGKRAPEGTVWAVEACKETFDILKENVELNELTNVKPLHLAIAKEPGTVKLYHNARSGNWGHSITTEVSDSYEETEAVDLAGFLSAHDIERLDLLKSNCEGAEFEILMNAAPHTLSKIDLIIALYHVDLSAGHTVEGLKSHLESAGFDVLLRNQSKGIRGWMIAKNRKAFKNASIKVTMRRLLQIMRFKFRRFVKFCKGCANGMMVRLKLKRR